jgi:sugar phosphate permease
MRARTLDYKWVILGVGAAGAGAFAALRMGLPALGPALRDAYGLTLSEIGVVFAAVAVGVMLTLVPWGMLTDRVGERPVLAGGLAATGLSLVAAAFAPSFAYLLAGLLLAGMAGASATGASGRAVMGWFARTERGLALGIRQMALPLGGALASLTLPWIAGAGGLRAALLSLAGLSFAAAAAAALWMRDAPAPPVTLPPPDAPPPTRDPRIWRLGAAGTLLVAGQSALLGFIVLFLHDARGVSVAAAAAVLAAVQLGGAAMRIVAGAWSDREGMRIAPMRSIAAAGGTLLALTAALSNAPGAVLYPVLIAASIAAMTWNGLAFTAAAEISGRARAGTAMSIQNAMNAVGSVVAPMAFGVLVDSGGWGVAFAVLALAPAAAFAVLAPLVGDECERAEARERRLAALPARLPA